MKLIFLQAVLVSHQLGLKGSIRIEMMTRRKAICLLVSVLVGACFAAAQIGLNFSVAPTASAAATKVLFESAAQSQMPQTLSVPVDSPRWDLQGQAKTAEYQGRKCLFLDGGAAILNDFELRDGVIDADVATPASRGFFGFQFRIANEGATAEEVYL